ncbi:hypothetical protein C8Q76DRAFT_796781 [Earliella scabrosa]|nr:hypothetical protein C8Q76DRAFT_796781 [Earliella scabrosa]
MPTLFSTERVTFYARSDLDLMRPETWIPIKIIIAETGSSNKWIMALSRNSRGVEVLYSRAICDGSLLSVSEAKQTVTLRRKAENPGDPHGFRLHFGDNVEFWKFLMYFFGSRLGGYGLTIPDVGGAPQPPSAIQPPAGQGTGNHNGFWGHGL